MKKVDFGLVSMSKMHGKFPRLEHCCEGFEDKPKWHPEIVLFLFGLRKQGNTAEFYNGSFSDEESILKRLKEDKPEKIIYWVNTPYIREKETFMREMSKISKLYLVAVPFFWKDKIMKDFPFVEDVFFDGEKGFKVDINEVEIDYDQFDLRPYLGSSFPIISSKYCPYLCTFCVAQKTGYAERKLEVLKKELTYLRKKGFTRFTICGDTLTTNKKRFIEMCNILRDLSIEGWSGDARVDHMSEEMYQPLKDSKGTLLFGLESANQKILDHIKKGTKLEQAIKNADKMNSMGIPFRYTVMFGFPWDSFETFKQMVALRKRVNSLNYHCLLLMPQPGNPLFEQIKEYGLIKEEDMDYEDFKISYVTPLVPTLHLSKEEVSMLVKKIMFHGTLNTNVIKNILKTKRMSDYPALLTRGLKLLTTGRRTWRELD
jgi:radical SAM superfamily enzyme YgiQ (UPF0313 family)